MNEVWQRLQTKAKQMQKQKMTDLFVQNPQQASQFSVSVGDIYLDYSKNFIDQELMSALLALAESVDLKGAISRLLTGMNVNSTENRPALHTALRRPLNKPLKINDVDVMQNIGAQLQKMGSLVEKLHAKK